MKQRFFHSNPNSVDVQTKIDICIGSVNTFVVGNAPRKCKCIMDNMDTLVFQVGDVRSSRYHDLLMVNKKTHRVELMVQGGGTSDLLNKVIGLYFDGQNFNYYSEEMQPTEVYVKVKVGDEIRSSKHNGRVVTIVHISKDGSLVCEREDGVCEIMKLNDMTHITYPIVVKHDK